MCLPTRRSRTVGQGPFASLRGVHHPVRPQPGSCAALVVVLRLTWCVPSPGRSLQACPLASSGDANRPHAWRRGGCASRDLVRREFATNVRGKFQRSMNMTVIAVVAMGEMGAGVAARLVERGARVLTSLAGRSDASAKRAKAAGVTVTDDAGLIAEAEHVPVDRAAFRCRRDRRAVPAADREGREEAGLYRLQRDCAANAGGDREGIRRTRACRSSMDRSSALRRGRTAPARASICPGRSRARPRR